MVPILQTGLAWPVYLQEAGFGPDHGFRSCFLLDGDGRRIHRSAWTPPEASHVPHLMTEGLTGLLAFAQRNEW